MNQMVLHVTVHWPAAHLELKPSTLSYGWCEFTHKPHQCKDKSPEEAVVGTKLDVVIIPAYILQQQLVLSVVNATAACGCRRQEEGKGRCSGFILHSCLLELLFVQLLVQLR
jgi:hypothetical protein